MGPRSCLAWSSVFRGCLRRLHLGTANEIARRTLGSLPWHTAEVDVGINTALEPRIGYCLETEEA